MVRYDTESIRRRILTALAGNRAPGFHFAGYFLELDWPRIGAVVRTEIRNADRSLVLEAMSNHTARQTK